MAEIRYMAKFFIGNSPVNKKGFMAELYKRLQNGRNKAVDVRMSTVEN